MGLSHLDISEKYFNSISGQILCQLIQHFERNNLFITYTISSWHLSVKKIEQTILNGLNSLGIRYFDLLLVKWPLPLINLNSYVRTLETLVNKGIIIYIGGCNLSISQFKKMQHEFKNIEVVANQLRANFTEQYHLTHSLPYYQKEKITVIACRPLDHYGYYYLGSPYRENLDKIAQSHDASIPQITFAWVINHDGVVAIPKAIQPHHVAENAQTANIVLSKKEFNTISKMGEEIESEIEYWDSRWI